MIGKVILLLVLIVAASVKTAIKVSLKIILGLLSFITRMSLTMMKGAYYSARESYENEMRRLDKLGYEPKQRSR